MTTAVLPDRSPAPAISPSRPRRVFFDAARLLAALAIVWLHAIRSPALLPSTSLGRFAVPFFTAAAVFLICESLAQGNQRTLKEYFRNRFDRLYVPFLAWTLIYLLFKFGKSVMTPNQPNDFPGVMVLVTGGFYHLWFLPFIFVVSVAVFAAGRNVIGRRTSESRMGFVSALLGTAIAFIPCPTILALAGEWPGYWWSALPAVFWGIAFAIVYRQQPAQCFERSGTALVGLAITIAATAWTWHVERSIFAENVSGLGFLLFALAPWRGSIARGLATLGPLAYGIYLSHMLFVKTSEATASALHWPQSALLDLSIFILAATASTALTWVLRRHLPTRWLVAS